MHLTGKPVIYFDWDGTLADSMELCMGEIALSLEWMGLPPRSESELRKLNGPTIEEAGVLLGIPPERMEEHLQLRKDAQVAIFKEKQKLFSGVYEMLETLRKEADLVLVSNGYPEYIDRSVDLTDTRGLFAQIQPCVEGLSKTQVLAMLLEKMKPTRCVMVGDRKGDLIAGRENGIPTIAAAYGYGTPEEWVLADQKADSVRQLQELLTDFIRKA